MRNPTDNGIISSCSQSPSETAGKNQQYEPSGLDRIANYRRRRVIDWRIFTSIKPNNLEIKSRVRLIGLQINNLSSNGILSSCQKKYGEKPQLQRMKPKH